MTESTNSFVTVVSGLPRSGTSLMMQVLHAGGMEVLADNLRVADEGNPQGYYEYDAVKRTRDDNSWVALAVGKAVKVIYKLLYDLPVEYTYRVVMMSRSLAEVVDSQNAMLQRLGRASESEVSDQQLIEIFQTELDKVNAWLVAQPNFSVIEVPYGDLVANPRTQVERVVAHLETNVGLDALNLNEISQFVEAERREPPGDLRIPPDGSHHSAKQPTPRIVKSDLEALNLDHMCQAVDPSLYRQRR